MNCCENENRLFVSGGRATSSTGSRREDVTVCASCGQLRVVGDVNGQHFRVTFHFGSYETRQAAAKLYDDWLKSEKPRDQRIEFYFRNRRAWRAELFEAGATDFTIATMPHGCASGEWH